MVSGYSADGSALPWGGRGRGFKSRYSDHKAVGFPTAFCFCIKFFITLCVTEVLKIIIKLNFPIGINPFSANIIS